MLPPEGRIFQDVYTYWQVYGRAMRIFMSRGMAQSPYEKIPYMNCLRASLTVRSSRSRAPASMKPA